MRTLIVSSGWHTRASIIPAPPPANQAKVNSCTSQKGEVYSTDQVDRGRCALLVGSFGGHCFNMWYICRAIALLFTKIKDFTEILQLTVSEIKLRRSSDCRKGEPKLRRSGSIQSRRISRNNLQLEKRVYLEGLRKIKRSIVKTLNLFFKKKKEKTEVPRVYDSRGEVAAVPNFVGSYDGEAEEAGRAEVYMTSHK